MRARPLPLLLLSLLLLALSGCGNSSGNAKGDPATLAPANSVIYAAAQIDPQGGQERNVRSILRRFPDGERVDERLTAAIDKALKDEDTKLSYSDDVKPWVGQNAGVFAAGFSPNAPDAALVVASKDTAESEDAIDRAFEGEKTDGRTHRDVDYTYAPDEKVAAGVVGDFLVIGSDTGFKSAVDASKGDSLAEARRYRDALAKVPGERLASFYYTPQLVQAILRSSGANIGPLEGVLTQLYGLGGDEPVVSTFRAEPDAVVTDSTARITAAQSAVAGAFTGLLSGSATPLLTELPGDAWLALGVVDVGRALSGMVDAFTKLAGVTGQGPDEIKRQIRRETGLDLERDVFGWMGDLALFVRGTDRASIGGGVVLETKDPGASAGAIRKLGAAIRREGEARVGRPVAGEGFSAQDEEMPEPIHFFQEGRRVVVAYGDEAARQAVDPKAPLGEAQSFRDAQAALGEGYELSSMVLVQPILRLAESFGASADADYAKARAYLQPLERLVAGTKREGDKVRSRSSIGVR